MGWQMRDPLGGNEPGMERGRTVNQQNKAAGGREGAGKCGGDDQLGHFMVDSEHGSWGWGCQDNTFEHNSFNLCEEMLQNSFRFLILDTYFCFSPCVSIS